MRRYRVDVLDAADQDVMRAAVFLANVSTDAAYKFLDDWDETLEKLHTLPNRFPAYDRIPTFHKIVAPFDFLIFFTINEDKKIVTIHRVLNGKTNIEAIL